MRDINPLIDVVTYAHRLTEAIAPRLFSGYDLVLDGTDNFPTRYLASDAAAINVPVLWASVLGFDAQVSLFWAQPPIGEGLTLRDVFPHPPVSGSVPSCSQARVVGAMVGQVGSLMAAEAVKLIIGAAQSLLGRILVFDQLHATWAQIPVRPRVSTGAPAPAAPPAPPTAAIHASLSYVEEPVPDTVVLDVREEEEVAAGVIPGSVHVPLALVLTQRGRDLLTPGEPLTIYCGHQPRSERAAQDLAAHGYEVHVLTGGYAAWTARHPHTPPGRP